MAFLKQMKRKQDHRTIVVPTITSLNPDTWKEIPGRTWKEKQLSQYQKVTVVDVHTSWYHYRIL